MLNAMDKGYQLKPCKVYKTVGQIRYMECEVCRTTFTAIGEAQKETEPKKELIVKENSTIKSKLPQNKDIPTKKPLTKSRTSRKKKREVKKK